MDITAIFDIGKTNKKLLLFDNRFSLVSQEEIIFDEIEDDDGFACEDIEKLLDWIKSSLKKLVADNQYNVKYVNFSTYGATLVFLDKNGERVAPVYNYLKPLPDGLFDDFYIKYGGVEEFSRKTASPALGMLNSGLQIYWLKYTKPEIFNKVKHILHLPQYISYIFTGNQVSEYTSIGCHTAMWDFDQMKYHAWMKDESICLPDPVPNETLYKAEISGSAVQFGTGIHDSSSSLVPYLKLLGSDNFILSSTGTWAINMNPFNREPLTTYQLHKDCLCYMSVDRQQVKSSRLFLGHIHDINVEKLADHFGVEIDAYKNLSTDKNLLKKIFEKSERIFFPENIPVDYFINPSKISLFTDFKSAYHQLMFELTSFEADAIHLIIDERNYTDEIYIIGGFAKNEIFCTLLAAFFLDKKVFTAELYNATALGAAMVVVNDINISSVHLKVDQQIPI